MDSYIICSLCKLLGSSDGNSLLNTDEAKSNHVRIHYLQSKILHDEITEEAILQQCFTKVERLVPSRSKCRQSLLDICNSLLEHQPKSGKIICNMCGVGISMRATNILWHAYAHSEVKVFECRRCSHTGSSVSCLVYHIRRAHNILKPFRDDFVDKSFEHFDEISNQIGRCYSPNYPRASGHQRRFIITSRSQDMSHRSIAHFCRSIFVQRSKPDNLKCNICGSRIVCQQGSFQACSMFQHAAVHMDVKLFSCRHCHHTMSSKSAMTYHLKTAHQITDGTHDHFDDRSEKFHSEYMDVIGRCFSDDPVKVDASTPTKAMNTIAAEAVIRNCTTGSQLTIERHLVCSRLIRKIIDSDGKIKCALCARRSRVKNSGRIDSLIAFSHIDAHLRKLLYRCKVCPDQFRSRGAVANHLKTKHALGRLKNYEYIADDFHEEIMDMLSKCYGTRD